MKECVYCAVNNDGQIEWVLGSSNKTRYFRTTKYLKEAVALHNKICPDNPWHIVQFDLNPTKVIQGVEILRALDSYGITREDAINFLRNDGWLKRHDEELTKDKEPVMVRSVFNNMCNMKFHYCGACGDGLPISAKRARFCPWCGRPVKWDE